MIALKILVLENILSLFFKYLNQANESFLAHLLHILHLHLHLLHNALSERFTKFVREKKKIAKYCGELIKDGDFIYLDSGTSTYEIIPHLQGKDVVVVTNGIYNMEKLIENDIKTYMLGGEVKPITKSVVGEQAILQIEDFRFSKAFLGANGITVNSAVTTPDISESILKRVAIKKAEESYILADSSKFGKVSFSKVCNLDEVTIVTDAKKEDIEEICKLTKVITIE